MNALSLEEKIAMLSGELGFYQGSCFMLQGYNSRPWVGAKCQKLNLEGIKFVDGPRGVVLQGGTTFPVAMCRGATFDTELENEIGQVIGNEILQLGGNCFGGVCVNLLRHPGWGRAQETFGEDTLLLSEMGIALVKGVESRGVMAVVKHFALNSMENQRFRVNVRIQDQALHEVYLRHFERIVRVSNPSFIMTAYNQCNGSYCGEHAHLLSDILKSRWNFQGAVMTDFVFGLRDAKKAMLAGQDLEMPFRQTFDAHLLGHAQADAQIVQRIDDAVTRLMGVQKRAAQTRAANCAASCSRSGAELALEAARKGIVLLKNDQNVLPLNSSQVKSLCIVGRRELVSEPNLGDHGSSNTQPNHVVSCEEGIRIAFPTSETHVLQPHHVDAKRSLVQDSDACIVVVGYTFKDEGEYIVPQLDAREMALFPPPRLRDIPSLLLLLFRSKWKEWTSPPKTQEGGGDRSSLALHPEDEALISQISGLNPRTIVVVMTGSGFVCETWKDKIPSLLVVWYPGQEGGTALGEILCGLVNPSGKLPLTLPKRSEDLPFFDRTVEEIDYGYFHGWRKLQADSVSPAFPFGFGLSYTTFVLKNAVFENERELHLSVEVDNVGRVEGDCVIQMYLAAKGSKLETHQFRAKKELIAFQRVSKLRPSESRRIHFHVIQDRFEYYDTRTNQFQIEPCEYELSFAQSCEDGDAVVLSTRMFVEE